MDYTKNVCIGASEVILLQDRIRPDATDELGMSIARKLASKIASLFDELVTDSELKEEELEIAFTLEEAWYLRWLFSPFDKLGNVKVGILFLHKIHQLIRSFENDISTRSALDILFSF